MMTDMDAHPDPAASRRRSRLRTAGLVFLGLGLAAVLAFWMLRPAPVRVELASVRRGNLQVWIEEEARSRVRERHGVHAPVSGQLQRIEVVEGDRVTQGSVLARLDPALPAALDARSLSVQQAFVESAQAALASAQARLARARAAARQSARDLERSQALAERGFIAASRAESERLAHELALREEDAQQAALESARQDLERSRAGLIEPTLQAPPGRAARQAVVIRAPVDGVVLRRALTDQTPVQAGTLLVEMADLTAIDITTDLVSTQAVQVKTGQWVELFDWGSQEILQARIDRIEPGAFTKVSALGVEEQRVRVVMRLLPSSAARARVLGDGWRLQARILVRSLDDMLQVPVAAVFPMPSRVLAAGDRSAGALPSTEHSSPPQRIDTLGVFVRVEGRAVLRAIEVADRSATQVAVRTGLQVGDAVVLYPPPRLRSGDRIEAED